MPKPVDEVLLPLRAVPQPHPNVSPGGDCGACCIAGLIKTSVMDVYKYRSDGQNSPFSWPTMQELVFTLYHTRTKFDRAITEVPLWHTFEANMTFGLTSWVQAEEWWRYIRMAHDAGYYGLAQVSIHGQGPGTDRHSHDHWALLCGTRSSWEEVKPEGKLIGTQQVTEVAESCSVHGLRWFKTSDYLCTRGGFNTILVRPKPS